MQYQFDHEDRAFYQEARRIRWMIMITWAFGLVFSFSVWAGLFYLGYLLIQRI